MELFKLFGTIAINNSEANEAVDETTGKAEKSESKITSAFKKIGTAVATYFAADKIISFGKSCVEAAASVKAANSQFEQTFGNMAGEADAAMKRVADSSGIMQTRLQETGTSIFAFARTTGMDSAEALKMMEEALNVTADSAAYYDRSLEDTAESLKSFLKGNFENDAALGLSCTETTRNAAANKLYGKSFIELSESQKQLTLLQMVKDANELSGAMGQAARESDGWENVTGNLKEAWRQFQAVIGTPILSALVPSIQKLSAGIGDFTVFLQSGTLNVGFFLDKLTSLFSSDFVAKMEEWIDYLSDIILLFADNTIDMFGSKISGVSGLFGALGDVIRPIIENYILSLIGRFDDLLVIWNDILVPALSFVIDAFLNLGTTILTYVAPPIQTISDKFGELQQLVGAAIQNYILPAIQAFIDMITQLYQENQDKIDLIGQAFQAGFEFIAGIVVWFVEIFQSYISPFLSWLSQAVISNMDGIKAVFQSAFDIIAGIAQFFIALFTGDWSGMWEAVKSILQAGVNFVTNLFNLLKSVITTVITAIKSKVSEIFTNIANTMSEKIRSAKETVLNIFDSIKSGISDKINAAKDTVSSVIETIKGLFNFTWSLPHISLPHFSISPSGWTIGDLLKGSIPSLGIEWYAKAMDDGMVMTEPTIFGYNPTAGKLLAGGEAGSETVVGTESLMNMIMAAVAGSSNSESKEMVALLRAIYTWLRGGGLKALLIDVLTNEVMLEWENRELARLVKKYA